MSKSMTKPLATQFIIADGARARWVKRSTHADDFVTERELASEPEPRGAEPAGGAFVSASGRPYFAARANVAPRRNHLRFVEQLTDAINAGIAQGGVERLAIVAPARMLSEISRGLSAPARARLAKTLAKNLAKTPDHQLMEWLRPMEAD
jgi:protein required for attachment to host cells